MASLFLSYAREDASRIGPLAAALEQDDHQVWWDRHISGGQEFADAIGPKPNYEFAIMKDLDGNQFVLSCS